MARLVAVDYDPFASQSAQPRLTPVDYDPFAPTLNARASGSAGAVNKKAEAIWGGSFDDWKKRKEADDAERARMVAESEAGNVGSRRAQDFQRKVAALNKEGDQTGDYSADSLRAGRSLEMGMEQGREQIGAGLQFAGETPLALADFFGRIRPKGETEQDRSNPVTEAGKDIRGAAVARQQEIAPLMIDRPDSLLSMQGAKYIAQSALQSAPTTGTGLAAAVINPAAGLSLMGAGAGSAKFADARAEDKNYWLSAEAGAAAAAAEVVPEMLPLGFLSGRLLKHLPGTAMKRMASSPAGRGALLALSEGASEGVTELSNIAYEIAREGKSYSDDEIEKRLIDATAVGTVMGGGMAAVAEVTGQSARAYDKSGIADLELENSLRDAIKPIKFDPATRIALQAQLAREESARAAQEKTARILGPDATPDAAAGAQIADDAFRAAGVGTVAAADMAEQDALARDLDAAQRDQLGSEAEIDRLLTGGINAQAQARSLGTVLDGQDAGRAGAAIPGFSSSLPAGVRTSYPGDSAESGASVGFVGNGSLGSRDAPAPQQFTELANGTIFVPGDPVQLRQRAADAGFDVRGLAETRNGVTGVRFGTGARDQIIGLFGGADPASAVEQSQPSAPPEAAAVIAPPALDAKRTYGDTVFDERAHDLLDFIALNGGLDRTALESEGIDPASWNSRAAKGKNERFFGKPLFRKSGGMSLETLREKARDAGFRTDKDVLDLIGDSLGGRKTFTPAGSEYQMALADVARQEADAQARQQRVNALPPSVPETDADAYIASRETEFDAPADRDGIDLADIESTLSSVSDTSPEQRASTQSLGGDYTAKLLQYKKDRRAWGLNPQQEQEYQDLLELDRETGKVGGRPMVGVRNKTAYVDALDAGELLPVQGFTDADDFKTLNDKLGHAAGDDAIREIGDALVAEFGEGNVFHRSGDEFLFQGTDQADVDAKMQRVRDRLSQITLRATDASGNVQEQRGIGLSYGTGTDEASADAALVADKQRRKESGQRVGQRRTSDHRGVGEESAGEGIRSGEGRGDSAAEGVGDARRDPSGSVPSGTESAPRVPPRNWLTGQRTADQGDADTGNGQGVGGKARPSVQSIRAAISAALGPKFLARLDNQKWFQIVDSVADLPPDVRKSITGGGIAGFVLGNRVFVVAEDAAGNPVGVLLHELGVHYGMTGILGEDFAPTLAKFKRLRAKDDRVGRAYERATDAADKDASGELTEAAKATLDEEALAYFVEENWDSPDTRGIVAKVIDAIKRLLNRLGMPLSMVNASPELLREVAIGAARMAADGRISVGKDGKLRYHRAFHGTPHDFDKFRWDDSTAGTGEGAQAYGYGLYFAGNREVAEHYKNAYGEKSYFFRGKELPQGYFRQAAKLVADSGTGRALSVMNAKLDEASGRLADASGAQAKMLTALQEDLKDAIFWLESITQSDVEVRNSGKLYEVELAPDEADYLDWDAPLSEQSEKVREGVRRAIRVGAATVARGDGDRPFSVSIDGKTLYRYRSEADAQEYADELNEVSASEARIQMDSESATTGEQAYRAISESKGGDREASRALHAAGIPGIRYLDGSSRGKGEGSRNFVIFDDSQVEVKAKYSRRVQDGRIRKTVAELTNAADSMGSWRDWYDRHDQTLRDVFGDDAELFQKLLSATSQAASVPANVGLALKAYRQLFSGEPFTGYLPAVIKNLDRVAASEALRGQKISEYRSANEGNADAIAVDRHIAMLFFGTKSPNRKQVAAAKNRIRAIAERLGWQPREVQAALWAYNQTLLGTAPENVKSYDKLIEASRARIDALRASIGRGEDRGARETGGTDGRVGAPERDAETGRGEAREVAVKYSRRADGGSEVAESDKLVALHNVSPEGLLFADKIGGLAVPSIGITKAATPFTGFGSVTLIGSRDLATPSGDNPVFSADAFTQRFPDVEWPAVPYKKANDFLASIDPDVRRRDTDELHDHMVNHPDRDKAIDDGRKSATFMKAWLAEVGDAPAQDVTEKRVPPHRAQWAVRPAWTDAVDRLAARGVDVRNLREGSPEWAELDKAARQAIEQEADSYADLSKTLADEMREGMLAFFGDSLSLGDGDRAIRFAMAKDEAPRIDRYATKKTLQDQIGDRMPQFSAWVTSKIAPLFGEPSIRIGRKKVPMTLDNIVEAMTSKAVAGKESTMTFSTGKAKAMNAKRYRTLEEVQADRAKIVSTEAEKGAVDASDKLIEQYRDAVLPYTSEIYNDRIDTWAALDASMKALADAGKKAATAANMRSALARNGFRGVDADAVQLGVDALIALRETVTDYFEAKPQRAVKLSEFAGAVVKSSEADQVRPVLEKHGVEVREYSGEDAERRVAIDEFTKELEAKRGKIRFSRRAQTITINGTERPTTDSTGKAIHPTEEGVRKFWEWFKDSKVVDDQGRPLVVYHGTGSVSIEEFMPTGFGRDDADRVLAQFRKTKDSNERFGYMNFRGGTFFSPKTDYASHYAGDNDPDGVIYPVYIRAENPVYVSQKHRDRQPPYGPDPSKTPDALILHQDGDINEIAVIDPTQVKSATGNSGTFSPTDPRIAYSRKTEEPEGLPPPVAIESHLSNMLKLRAFFDSAVDVMARQPGLKPLADAVRSYFDNVRRRQGLVNEVLRAPVKAASKADLDAFERYQYALQNNLRDDVAEELAGMTDKGRALVSAWEKIAKLTNDENQKVGVQVFDPKIGGWRKIGTARNFFPRVLKPKFQEAMRQPHKYPAEWNRLVRILLDAGRIQSAEDAQEFLNTAFSNESAFEYFAGIEKARMEPLPRDLYDYSMDAAIGYKDAWADRLSQIEAFGQKIGQGDQAKDKFDEVLLTVTDDNTRNYVTRVRERITNTNSKSPFYKFMANMNTLVTGLMLGNPATAALNIVGGLSNNAMVFPLGPNLKALKELRHLGAGIRDAVAKGVLIDDYMGVSADAAAQGVSERLSNLTQGLLNWGGYNGTEYINRVHSMLVGKHFLSDSLAAINKNPRSRKSLLATAFMQRNGFDVDVLAAESMKPADERPETNKFLRFASNLTQGSYKIDQTPIFVDEPIGKFLFKYQKFGTQINRVFYQQVLKPFAQSVFKGGEPVTLKNADGTEAQERVRNFVPLLRFIAAAIPGGMLVQFIREALFGYGEDGPDEDEIRRKLADGETAAAAAMLAERAFIAITALGAGGFLGNYMQTAKDFQERQRFKNPLDPPGLAPVKSFANFVMKLNDQGKITLDDIEQEIQNNVSLYRTGKRLLSSGINMINDESVAFAAREAARREHNHVRYMARRYADSVGIEAKRRAPSEIAATANTPTNRAIKDALLLGDGETARALAAEYVASFDNAYDAANALASIRNSIRLGQPALVQLAPSETERRRFMRWAFSNLTPEGYARIKDTDEKYRKAAASSGLWKPESDAAAMKRDRKADESKAQWSDSQRNSFLRSKGLKR